jgi:hypothetical protein
MRAIPGYLLLTGLVAILSSCAYPTYFAQPALVDYPQQRPGIYYPAQRAGIYYPPAPGAYPAGARTRNSEAGPARQPGGEQPQASGRTNGRQGPGNGSGWIDPEP